MLEQGLGNVGIRSTKRILYNLSYEELFKHEMDPSLTGFERGQLTTLGAVNVDTGTFMGRSPKDKYIVVDEISNCRR